MANKFHNVKSGMSFELNASPVGLQDGDFWFDGYSFNFYNNGGTQPVGAVETKDDGVTVETLTTTLDFGPNLSAVTDGYGNVTVDLNNWQIKTSLYTAVNGDKIFADTSGGSFTITLPSTPSTGHTIRIVDPTLSWNPNNLTIARGNAGHKINGILADFIASTPNIAYELVFYGPTNNWLVMIPPSVIGG